MSLLASGAIAAGAAIASTATNAIAAGKMNKRAEKFNRWMWDQQGDRELAYWNMQNEYNNPTNQMQRLQDAGLNPNLVYGNGADAQAAPMRPGGAPSAPNYKMPNYDFNNVVDQVLSVKQREASINQINAQTDAIKQNTEIGSFDLEVKQRIGLDRLEREAQGKLQAMNARNAKEVREFDSWMDVAFDQNDGTFHPDFLGGYVSGSNSLVKKAMQAGLQTTVQNLNNLRAGTTLRDDQHKLNQVELELRNFSKSLSDIGLNSVSANIISKVLQLIFGK